LLALALGLGLAAPAWAQHDRPDCRPGEDGQLALFQDLYWRWVYGGLNLPVDGNSNAVVHNVVMMPIPNTPGDGTPGTQAVTLEAHQSWMLPFWNLLGTSYTDGTPPDQFLGLDVFKTLDIKFTVDGKTIVSTRNVMEYFSKFTYEPPVLLNSPPYLAIIWFEGVGILHGPLSPGTHTLQLDVKNTEKLPPNFGGGVIEYHNTWNVTVNPPK